MDIDKDFLQKTGVLAAEWDNSSFKSCILLNTTSMLDNVKVLAKDILRGLKSVLVHEYGST